MKKQIKFLWLLILAISVTGCQKIDEAKDTITSIAQEQAQSKADKRQQEKTTTTATTEENPLAFSQDNLLHKVFTGTAQTAEQNQVSFQMNFNLLQIKDALNPTAPTQNNVLLADSDGSRIIGNGKFEQLDGQTVKLSGRDWTTYEQASLTMRQVKKGEWQVDLKDAHVPFTTATVKYDEEKTAALLKDASTFGQRLTPYGFASTNLFTDPVSTLAAAKKAVEKTYKLAENELTGRTETVDNEKVFVFTVDKPINEQTKEIVVIPTTGEYYGR
ncbi:MULTISPECIES: hypothetical protein [Enterococcus]|uniref:hypothetical protein n=1 Tax=Enterococcus TaxID=1350 RepID=UPI0018A0AF13|nr:hypothetical protein [Enterococcus dispar]